MRVQAASNGLRHIDGSVGEGGGQLLRLAVALSAVTRQAVRVENIRAGRAKPGLAAQHLAAVRAVAALCGAAAEGLTLRSRSLVFKPGQPRGGEYQFDVGTAGGVTLVLQALLPVLLAGQVTARVRVRGGTDVDRAPPVDYLDAVLLPLLARLGARVRMRLLRRGYFPRGGGEIELGVAAHSVRAVSFQAEGEAATIRGLSHVAGLPERVAARMTQAAYEPLAAAGMSVDIETRVLTADAADGSGGAIVCWAERGNSILGAARVAKRGVRAEALGAAVGESLAADLAAGVALDTHAADQLLVYLALAGGGRFTTRRLTPHARTAMWLIGQFLPIQFDVQEADDRVTVTVRPRATGT